MGWLRLLVSRPFILLLGALVGGLAALGLREAFVESPPLVRRTEAARLSVARWMELAAVGRTVSGYREAHEDEFPPDVEAILPIPQQYWPRRNSLGLPGADHGWELIYIPLPEDAPDHELLAYFLPFLDEPDKEPGFHALYADGQVRRVPIDEALRTASRNYGRNFLRVHGLALANAARLYGHDHFGRYAPDLATLESYGYLAYGWVPDGVRYHMPAGDGGNQIVFSLGASVDGLLPETPKRDAWYVLLDGTTLEGSELLARGRTDGR
jgi:hypothetical protein